MWGGCSDSMIKTGFLQQNTFLLTIYSLCFWEKRKEFELLVIPIIQDPEMGDRWITIKLISLIPQVQSVNDREKIFIWE